MIYLKRKQIILILTKKLVQIIILKTMKNKLANKFFESSSFTNKKCDEKGCNEDGKFIAPKSPNSGEKYFFCLKHIKLYNKSSTKLRKAVTRIF